MQKSISSFFKPATAAGPAKKRARDADADKQAAQADAAGANASETNEQEGDESARVVAKKPRLDVETRYGSMGESWATVLEPEFNKEYMTSLHKFLDAEKKAGKTIYPPEDRVFEWTKLCAFEDVRVVILGQDPYHGPGQAHGLCFSVLPGVRPPPSLANMYKELVTDIPGFTHPGHGYLAGWAAQGVLLLNACLTVRKGEANSHANKGWEKFTDAVIQAVNDRHNGVVFILWGGYAAKKGAKIDKKRHHVLQGAHPSPLSAHRGFLGCKHFSKCNDMLEKSGKVPIDWQDVDGKKLAKSQGTRAR